MTTPTNTDIDATLQRIERASSPNRELARERIEQFRLDREKGEKPLPTTNVHDDKGAPVLDRDAVLRRSYPNHAQRKA